MSNWTHLTLDELCNFEKGITGLASAIEGQYPLVATGVERRSCDTFQFDTAAVCIPLVSSTGHGHASLNHVHYQEGKFALGTILVAVIPKDTNVLNAQFLHLYLSRLKDIILVPLMTGAANVSLSVSKIKQVKIPVPSIAEQLKVVSLFNRMDNEQSELSDEISTQQELLKKLRQSILQEAIEGKLTAQWRQENPNVEPASKLLEKIRAKQEQLITEKKIKKEKSFLKINKEEDPFVLPHNWEWVRLGNLYNFIDYRGMTPNKIDQGIRLITARNVKQGYLLLEPEDFISENEYNNRMTRGFPKNGDILFTTEAPLGNVAILDLKDEQISTGQRLITFQAYLEDYDNRVVLFFMLSGFFQNYLFDQATGMTAKGIKSSRLIEMLIPLPPQQEQSVIIEKIESLFQICDELEQQINKSKVNIEMLMQAVLKEAFEN